MSKYHEAKEAGELADLPEDLKPYADSVFTLVNSVFSTADLPKVENGRPKTNPLNDNFAKQEFKELWARINHKAVYRVEFETPELIVKCVNALDSHLRVTQLQFTIEGGEQTGSISKDELESGSSFEKTETRTEFGQSVQSKVKYDLVGNLASNTQITRDTGSVASLVEIEGWRNLQVHQNHPTGGRNRQRRSRHDKEYSNIDIRATGQ